MTHVMLHYLNNRTDLKCIIPPNLIVN